MGLDMYLEKRTYVKNWEHTPEDKHHKITITRGGKPRNDIDTKKISYIIEEAGQWRKANAVHVFFVKHCGNGEDNCQSMYVEKEVLEELLDNCKKIIKASKLVDGKEIEKHTLENGKIITNIEPQKIIEDPTIAKEILPTQAGFFFGSTDYDEYYLDDIRETIKICEEALKSIKNGSDIYYQASW